MLYQAFQSRGLKSDLEVPVKTEEVDRRADVMVWSPDGCRVAVEIQHSNISLEDIHARTSDYFRLGIPVVWVILAKDNWFSLDQKPYESKIEGYAAPDWQRWIHGYNFGHLWIAAPTHNVMIPARLLKREGSRRKTLIMHDPVHPSTVRIRPFKRPESAIGRYKFPGGVAARFELE